MGAFSYQDLQPVRGGVVLARRPGRGGPVETIAFECLRAVIKEFVSGLDGDEDTNSLINATGREEGGREGEGRGGR